MKNALNFRDLTILLISYYSSNDIMRIIKKINRKIKVIIIENAQEKGFKNKFSNFKNVKIVFSKKNLGQVGGINLGFKKIKTKYAVYMDPDVDFKKTTIINFLKIAYKIKDFVILAPQHERSKYINDFKSNKPNKHKDLDLMKMVHGHFLFLNMNIVRKIGGYDKKFWMYYDETDYCLRAYRKGQKIYVIPHFNVDHKGGSSIRSGKNLKIEAHHNWHYMWSKFYFFKKNYSTFEGYKKTINDLILSVLKFLIFFIIDKRKRVIYQNRVSGLLCSYFGTKSYKRL